MNPQDKSMLGGGMMGGMGAYGGGGGYGGGGADGASSDGGGAYGAYGGGGGMGAYGGGGGYGGGAYGGGLDGEVAPPETYDKTVEFFGIIYIYNPVDKQKLKTDEANLEGDGEPGTDDVASN